MDFRRVMNCLVAIASLACANVRAEQVPTKDYNIYFDRADRQFTIDTSEGNTPRLNFYTWQDSSNVFVPTGYVCKLMFSPSNDPSEVTAMCTVTGTVMNSTNLIQFNVLSNDMYTTMSKGYAVVKITSGSQIHSYSRGYVNILDAPEVSGITAVNREVPFNWSGSSHTNYVPYGPLQAGTGVTFRAYGSNGQYAIDVDLSSSDNLSVKSNLYVGRNAIVTGTLDVTGNVLHRGSQSVAGDMNIAGGLTTTGAITSYGEMILLESLLTYGSATFVSPVYAYGAINAEGNVTFTSNVTFEGNACASNGFVVGSGAVAYDDCLAVGDASRAQGGASFAGGVESIAYGVASMSYGWGCEASNNYSTALGVQAKVRYTDGVPFVWNPTLTPYSSHGTNTFNINPLYGTKGFYIGDTNLYELLSMGGADIANAASNQANRAELGVVAVSGRVDTIAGSAVTNGANYWDIEAPANAPAAPSVGYVRLYGQTNFGQENIYWKQPDGSSYRVGRDLIHTVYNDEDIVLTQGQAVCWTTNMTQTAHHAKRAMANDATNMPCQGIVVGANIAVGGSGTIMWQGLSPTGYLSSVNAALPYGAPLFVSPTEHGALTPSRPISPNNEQIVGFVSYNGAMDVRLGEDRVPTAESIFRTYQLWSASNSVVVSGYKAMRTLDYGAGGVGSWTNTIASNNQYVAYVSGPSGAGLTRLQAGLYQVTATMRQTAGGAAAISMSAELYIRGTNGVESEVTPVAGTSAQAIGNTALEYIFSLNVSTDVVMNATDYIVLKFKSIGRSGSPVLVISQGFLNVPVPSSQFVLQSDYAMHTGSWNQASTDASYATNWIATNTSSGGVTESRVVAATNTLDLDIIGRGYLLPASTSTLARAVTDSAYATNWIATNTPAGGTLTNHADSHGLGGNDIIINIDSTNMVMRGNGATNYLRSIDNGVLGIYRDAVKYVAVSNTQVLLYTNIGFATSGKWKDDLPFDRSGSSYIYMDTVDGTDNRLFGFGIGNVGGTANQSLRGSWVMCAGNEHTRGGTLELGSGKTPLSSINFYTSNNLVGYVSPLGRWCYMSNTLQCINDIILSPNGVSLTNWMSTNLLVSTAITNHAASHQGSGNDPINWLGTNTVYGRMMMTGTVNNGIADFIGPTNSSIGILAVNSGAAQGPTLRFGHAGGTEDALGTTSNAYLLGRNSGIGVTGGVWTTARATVDFYATNDWSGTQSGAYISYSTTPDDGIVRVERGRLMARGERWFANMTAPPVTPASGVSLFSSNSALYAMTTNGSRTLITGPSEYVCSLGQPATGGGLALTQNVWTVLKTLTEEGPNPKFYDPSGMHTTGGVVNILKTGYYDIDATVEGIGGASSIQYFLAINDNNGASEASWNPSADGYTACVVNKHATWYLTNGQSVYLTMYTTTTTSYIRTNQNYYNFRVMYRGQ